MAVYIGTTKVGNIFAGAPTIITGTDTTDANAVAGDVRSTKTCYVNGSKVTGTLVINELHIGSTEPSASTGADGDVYFVVES